MINHGSTGRGVNPNLFAHTWFAPDLADFLNDRGWIVAFPQRRGRGKSDGLYDEGFAENRARGYTGDIDITLRGADRALSDIDAAIAALRRRQDIAPAPVLIGGVSRGGVLSVAYAGLHPKQVAGVINFVGGWLGEGYPTASTVNHRLFERGASYGRPTIWLYGQHGHVFIRLLTAGTISPPSRRPAAKASSLSSICRLARVTLWLGGRSFGRAPSTII